jgi:hypothetical protein
MRREFPNPERRSRRDESEGRTGGTKGKKVDRGSRLKPSSTRDPL